MKRKTLTDDVKVLTLDQFNVLATELLTKMADMELMLKGGTGQVVIPVQTQPLPLPVRPDRRTNAALTARIAANRPARRGKYRPRVWIMLAQRLKPEVLAELPLPARNVYRAIESAPEHRTTIVDVAEITDLSKKTVENQLIPLRRLGAVRSSPIGDPVEPSHPMRRATDFVQKDYHP